MRFILTGRVPSKKNSRILICRGRYPMSIPNGKYTSWHKDASLQLKNQAIPRFSGVVSITMTFFFPDKRKTDLSNKGESVNDLLVDNKIIIDDNWNVLRSLHYFSGGVDKENPRVEIDIVELEGIDEIC
ncbi:MAG: RusA family crossover junction endodeoxyribonuclease [Nitrospiria bacterium]